MLEPQSHMWFEFHSNALLGLGSFRAFFFFFSSAGDKSRALHMLGKHSTIKLHSLALGVLRQGLAM
jgi:hypothetical protein